MTISDLRCDGCGRTVGSLSGVRSPDGSDADPPANSSPVRAVRFVYDPGVAELRDDSGLACEPCWERATAGFTRTDASRQCAACGATITRATSLRLRRIDDPQTWRLCARHAVAFLNGLRTVEPKFDLATFRFPTANNR